MDELKEYAILIDAVREANPALKDADIFDVICHVAFCLRPSLYEIIQGLIMTHRE